MVAEVRALRQSPTLGDAVTAFLGSYEKIGSEGTRKTYRGTLNALLAEYGHTTALGTLDPARFHAWFRGRFGGGKPATYARHLSTIRSALRWWMVQGWLLVDPSLGLERAPIPIDRTKARDLESVEELWRRNLPLRDKTLWRMLYETAARAQEILSLNVEDLDTVSKRAKVTSKGGDIEWVWWQTGTAMLLPRLLAGRTRGPLFLADRLPTRPTPTADMCPVTGRARLSYRRAEELFKEQTGGWTLHMLRHSALTHDAERGTPTTILMGRSRHKSARTILDRYAVPSAASIGRHVAASDPAARRR